MKYSVMPISETGAQMCTELVTGHTVHCCLQPEAPIQWNTIRVLKPRPQVESESCSENYLCDVILRSLLAVHRKLKNAVTSVVDWNEDDEALQESKPHNSQPAHKRQAPLSRGRLLWLMTTLIMASVCPFSDAAGFILSPVSLNVTVGTTAEFFCQAEGDVVSWIVNSTSLNTLNDTNITVDGPIIDGIRTQILRIVTGVQHNNTVIQCRSIIIMPEDVVVNESPPALLMVQGLLDAVGDPDINLVNGTLCLSWTPPFTLDLTDVDPDLHYMIEITSTVAAEDRFTMSCDDCSTGYKFTANSSSPCDSFTFVVVPVNAAGNGTPSDPLQGSFIEESPAFINITDANITVTVLQADQLMIQAPYPSTSVCQFSITFTSSDGLEPELSCKKSADLDMESGGFTLVVQNGSSCQPFTLPLNRIFDMDIEAQNGAGITVLANDTRLSTHDAQDATFAVGPMPGTVTVSVKYAVNTSAMGHLTILVNSSNMAVAFTAPDRSNETTTIRGLLTDMYTALVFDVESSGLPSTAAADSEIISVDEGSDENQPTDSNLSAVVEVNADSGICTSCMFATGNSVGCVVIMYSAMAQLVVHSISREGPSESNVEECFTVPFGDYAVAVFNRESNNMIALNPATVSYVTVSAPPSPTPSPTSRPSDGGLSSAAVIGIAIGAVIIILIIVIIACLIYWRCRLYSKKTVDRVKLLRTQSTFSSQSASLRTVQDGASPLIATAVPDGNEMETPLSGTNQEEHTTTNTNTASTFGHGSFGYVTIGPAASPGPDKNKTVDYSQLDLTPGANPPPLIDPVPYQTVQVEPASAEIKTTEYVELDLSLNENPPPQADTVTYQTIQPKPASARPSQQPKPILPALNINDLHILLILLRPIQFLWYQLGSQLGIRDDSLNQIAEYSSEPRDCSTEMLSQWLEYQPERSPPTWEDITKAIQQLGEDSDSAKQVAEQFQCIVTTGMRPEMQHSPLLLPADEPPPPLPPRGDSQSWPTDQQLQSTPSPLPTPEDASPVPPPSPLPTPEDVSPVPPPEDDLSEAQPSPRQSPSSPHAMMREPSYSPPDTPQEAPGTPNEEPLHFPQPRRAPPLPPTNISGPSSYSPTHALREEPPRRPLRRRSPPPPPIGELPPYSPPSSHPPPYTPPLTPRALFSSPPIEFHGTMV